MAWLTSQKSRPRACRAGCPQPVLRGNFLVPSVGSGERVFRGVF